MSSTTNTDAAGCGSAEQVTPGRALLRPPEPGDTLYGFCGGYFGRDSYGDKIVVAVGRDWLVARECDRPTFAAVDPARLAEYLTPEEYS